MLRKVSRIFLALKGSSLPVWCENEDLIIYGIVDVSILINTKLLLIRNRADIEMFSNHCWKFVTEVVDDVL